MALLADTVPISLDFTTDGQQVKEVFLWNHHNSEKDELRFAQTLCKERKLPELYAAHIAQEMRRQVHDHAEVASLPRDTHRQEQLVPVRLDVVLGNLHLKDQMVLDLNDTAFPAEQLAAVLCKDLKIPHQEVAMLAYHIRQEVRDLRSLGAGRSGLPPVNPEQVAPVEEAVRPSRRRRSRPEEPAHLTSCLRSGVVRPQAQWEAWGPVVQQLNAQAHKPQHQVSMLSASSLSSPRSQQVSEPSHRTGQQQQPSHQGIADFQPYGGSFLANGGSGAHMPEQAMAYSQSPGPRLQSPHGEGQQGMAEASRVQELWRMQQAHRAAALEAQHSQQQGAIASQHAQHAAQNAQQQQASPPPPRPSSLDPLAGPDPNEAGFIGQAEYEAQMQRMVAAWRQLQAHGAAPGLTPEQAMHVEQAKNKLQRQAMAFQQQYQQQQAALQQAQALGMLQQQQQLQ